MQVIPVLDLRKGVVVRGVAGNRATYRPIDSRLASSSDPREVATALCSLCGHRMLYVADLDALEHDAPDWPLLRQLAADGFYLIVDAGLRGADRALQLVECGVNRVVVALESVPGPSVLVEILECIGPGRTTFSLDLKSGRPLCATSSWDEDPLEIAANVIERGVISLIVLDLAGVGVHGGVPTVSLCRDLRIRYPRIELMTGGGVRNVDDLRLLHEVGVDGVLMASALHDGGLSREDLQRLATPN